jgi:ATP-binding cassette subfamily B protein
LRRRAIIALFLLFLQQITALAVAPLLGKAVDVVGSSTFGMGLLATVIGGFVVARLLQQIFDELKHYVFARVAQRAIRSLALKTFRHLHALSLRFHLDRQTGGLSRVVERGVKSIELLLTFAAFHIFPTLLGIVLVCGVLWWKFDWRFALVSFVTLIGYAIYTIWITEWRLKFRRRMNAADEKANTRAIDSLLNYETVKYFGAEEKEATRYEKTLRVYEDAAIKNRTSLSLLNIGQGLLIACGLFVVMMLAGIGVAEERYTPGDFVVVYSYILQLYLPLNFLGSVYREIRQAVTDMDRMFSLLDEKQEVFDLPGAPAFIPAGGAIEFRNVRFGYGRGDVLNGVSFTVAAGNKVAIVGPSGSGKSTIARLLFRFYDPQNGTILIDDQDIRLCRQDSVRAAIGVVPQDSVLFNDTLLHNIRYGHFQASSENISRAAQQAAIDTFINTLPEGYDTIVGERGLKLSGGEKQRVAIARAILKNPVICVFDEATSALDSLTEKSIQQAMSTVSSTRTTLVIAHRLSTVADADEIFVLSAGQIIEHGQHEQLLAQNGLYTAMWQQQRDDSELQHNKDI